MSTVTTSADNQSNAISLSSLSLDSASASASASTSTSKVKVARTPRPRPADDVETMYSKALSYILRHGAAKESLTLTDEGFVRVDQLLKRPKLRGLTMEMLKHIVDNNAKSRFAMREEASGPAGELELWIRANQGHSLIVERLELEKITSPEEIPQLIHGTYVKNWESISKEGLKIMTRNHLHCATGLLGDAGVTSGMRANCDLYIYLNVPLLLQDSIELLRSSNNVILTSGISGVISPKYFLQVTTKSGDQIFPTIA